MALPFENVPGSDSHFELARMMSDPPRFLEERYAAHGSIFRTRWVVPLVFLVGPEANKTVHITKRASFSYREGYQGTAFGRLFDGTLLLEDGEEHAHDRDILQPAVGRLGLQATLEMVQAIWRRTVDGLADGKSFDAYEFVRSATFEVSANALLALELEDFETYRLLFDELLAGSMAHVDWRLPFGKLDRGLNARAKLIEHLLPRVEAAREREPKGLLGLLAHHRDADGNPLPSKRIAEHLLLLFWAGYDTTASSGSWLLYELARAPHWQERLVAEQKEQLEGDAPPLEALDKLEVHSWVLKEIERLRPVVLFFPRRTVEPLETNGFDIPAETLLFYSAYLTHRIPELFPEPGRFSPERWDPARGKDVAPSTALVGFGGGPRICLGKAFAVMQLRVMLTTLLRRFRVEPDPSVKERVLPLPMYRLQGARLVPRAM